MKKVLVLPVTGRRCKDPETLELLPEKGKKVYPTGYWKRRINDGDCVIEETIFLEDLRHGDND